MSILYLVFAFARVPPPPRKKKKIGESICLMSLIIVFRLCKNFRCLKAISVLLIWLLNQHLRLTHEV